MSEDNCHVHNYAFFLELRIFKNIKIAVYSITIFYLILSIVTFIISHI